MDLGFPVIAALNKMDAAEQAGLRIEPTILSETFGIGFIPICATTGKGITSLKQALRTPLPPAPEPTWNPNGILDSTWSKLEKKLLQLDIPKPRAHALQLLADPDYRIEPQKSIPLEAQVLARELANECVQKGTSPEDLISRSRTQFASRSLASASHQINEGDQDFSDKIDSVALHPFWGWGLLAALLFGVFWSIFHYADYPMGFIEEQIIGSLQGLFGSFIPEGDFHSLVVDGIIGGVGSVLVFLPQILLLFFFIGLLESSGYMARAAFMMDKVMTKVGLSGKAFLPLLSGHACAIPAVMATRTIPNAKERLATILVLPWTSCAARLPVYLLLVPLLISGSLAQTITLFGIYLLGVLSVLLAAKLIKPRLGPSDPPQFLLELPPYRKPDLAYVLRQVLDRGLAFLKKAGTIILGISILLWFLETFPKSDSEDPAVQQANSYMGQAGKIIEPVVSPLGWDEKTGTAMLSSFAAREVFVSALAIAYKADNDDEDAQAQLLTTRIQEAKRSDGSPVFTLATILSLIVFYIYALQCLPTTAVVKRETNSWKWAIGQLVGMTLFAWLAAFLTYRIASLFT